MTRWRHQMETFFALLALCAGNSPVPVNSPHKCQWRGALMFSLICARINGWVNNHKAGDLRCHRGHYCIDVMWLTRIQGFYWPLIGHRPVQAYFTYDTISPFIPLTSMAQAFSRNETHMSYGFSILNHCDLMTSYGNIILCKHWFM